MWECGWPSDDAAHTAGMACSNGVARCAGGLTHRELVCQVDERDDGAQVPLGGVDQPRVPNWHREHRAVAAAHRLDH